MLKLGTETAVPTEVFLAFPQFLPVVVMCNTLSHITAVFFPLDLTFPSVDKASFVALSLSGLRTTIDSRSSSVTRDVTSLEREEPRCLFAVNPHTLDCWRNSHVNLQPAILYATSHLCVAHCPLKLHISLAYLYYF
jgi:hypothetical protein